MLTPADKAKIKARVLAEYAPGASMPMTYLTAFLIRNRLSHREFGYDKSKEFLLEMPELFEIYPDPERLTLCVKILGEAAQVQAPAKPEPTPAAKTPELSPADKERIKACILQEYAPGDTPVMAAVSGYLINCHLSHREFGFEKGKELFKAMPELFEPFNDPESLAARVRILATPENEAAREEVLADIPTPTDDRIPAGDLRKFCDMPTRPMEILGAIAGKDAETIRTELVADYADAVQHQLIRFFEDKLIFPCRYTKEDGSSIEITLKPSGMSVGRPWFVSYIDTVVHTQTVNLNKIPGKQLELFAYLGNRYNFLSELSRKALAEDWEFANSELPDFYILGKYIQYTFYRLKLEDKICISFDNSFAAFNTGLVDPHYDDIFACFVPNAESTTVPWKFEGFCIAGERGLGKRLVEYFNPLPQTASYFARKEDLLFDLDKPLVPDHHHIIIDNIARLPLGFLQDQFYGCREETALVEQLAATHDHRQKTELYAQLQGLLENNTKLFNRLRYRLEDAIELARKQVRWNFKTAIPSYYPRGNSMNLLLPLELEEDNKAGAVLVVELTPSGNYQGQTILTMQQAYIDARLICRPNSEWLTASVVSDEDDTDEEEY